MQPLMRIIDVAEYLGTTPGAARNWLKKKNVPIIDLGRGRGLGLRFKFVHVEEAVNAELVEKNPGAQRVPKKTKLNVGPIRGRSRAEVVSELTGMGPVQ